MNRLPDTFAKIIQQIRYFGMRLAGSPMERSVEIVVSGFPLTLSGLLNAKLADTANPPTSVVPIGTSSNHKSRNICQ
jgi:hypothetical protein